jgi:hypothetical protein
VVNKFDNEKDIFIKILKTELNISPVNITRFSTGYCHSVYHVKTKIDESVLRVTSEENKEFYFGSLKWLSELTRLEIPVPKILKHGQYENVYYTLISFIQGKDIGEIYHTLSDSQKRDIVGELATIQKTVSTLPSIKRYGYNNSFATWSEFIKSCIKRSHDRITRNKVFNPLICDEVAEVAHKFRDYFLSVKPTAFLDDITTKNVLVHEGKLAGIVDIDEICYGDSIMVLGLTNMALLSMKADTKYINYWLEEMHASTIEKKAMMFYTLLFCIDFMAEQGMTFNNDISIPKDQKKIKHLSLIYNELMKDML